MIQKIRSLKERRIKKKIISHMVDHTEKHHRVYRGHLADLKEISWKIKRNDMKHRLRYIARMPLVKASHFVKTPAVKGYKTLKKTVFDARRRLNDIRVRHRQRVAHLRRKLKERKF